MPENWGGNLPADGDDLFFAGAIRLANTNDLPAQPVFGSITFLPDAGPFSLSGAPVALTGGITNLSVAPQTNNLDLRVTDLTVHADYGALLVLRHINTTNGTLSKHGPGRVLLNGTNQCRVIIHDGTLNSVGLDRFGPPGAAVTLNGGTLATAGTVACSRAFLVTTNNGTIDVDAASSLTLNQTFYGPGAFTKTGSGTLALRGGVISTGPLTVNGGTLHVSGNVTGPSSITVAPGATLSGNGTISPDVLIQDGAILGPGTNGLHGPATLTLSNLVLNPNSVLRLHLNAPENLGGTNDLIRVRGDLTLAGILKVSGRGGPGLYPLIKYEGVVDDRGLQLGPALAGSVIVDPTNKVVWLNAIAPMPSQPAPTRVLFVGNSLTLYENIPAHVAALAVANGDWFSYATQLAVNTSLQYHQTNATCMPQVDSGNYDLVMLQEYSSRPSFPPDRDSLMYPVVRDFHNHATNASERLMLYETWGYPYGDGAHCWAYDTPPAYRDCSRDAMNIATRLGYARIANELGLAISPVGLAWLMVQTERPAVMLYTGSGSDYHQGPAGGYLAACVHYAAIFGRSPVGNPYRGSLADPALAAYLQEVAERVVLGDPFAVDQFGFGANHFYWAKSWPEFANRVTTDLPGVVISGADGMASPAVKLDADAGVTNDVYLGIFGNNDEVAGQGRLFVDPGASLVVTDALVVGKEGQGWLNQRGGRLSVPGTLSLAEQPGSQGVYNLSGGSLDAREIVAGAGTAAFNLTGGQLSFGEFGSVAVPFRLAPDGGTLLVSNACTLHGDYTPANAAGLLVHAGAGQLVIDGNAFLGGRLAVALTDVPVAGQSFTLLQASALAGQFDCLRLPQLRAQGLAAIPSYTANSVVVSIVDALADSNTNGLPDWWEITYFRTLDSGQNWTNSFLGDGVPNGVKYAMSVDPTRPNAPGLPAPALLNGSLTLFYKQRTGGTGAIGIDYRAENLTYTVEAAQTLVNPAWQAGPDQVEWTGFRVDNGDGTETVAVRAIAPPGGTAPLYLRLSISR